MGFSWGFPQLYMGWQGAPCVFFSKTKPYNSVHIYLASPGGHVPLCMRSFLKSSLPMWKPGTFPKLSPPHLPPDIVSWSGPEQPPLSTVAFILLLFSPSPKVNPPYYVPLVELVPHPETAPATMDRTYALMRKIGQSPVRVLKEIDGFVLNRLQYAVIGEAWRLVEVRAPCHSFLFGFS